MLQSISFCINTSQNEKEYIELLLQSLLNGIDVNIHEIIIFVDSDNQNTTGMLLEQKSLFPKLKIIKNNGDPIGYQKNINYMFEIATHERVSYLQSDMVVSLKYDEAILSHLKDNMILSATRVEPPLHAPHDNPINYVRDSASSHPSSSMRSSWHSLNLIKTPINSLNTSSPHLHCTGACGMTLGVTTSSSSNQGKIVMFW